MTDERAMPVIGGKQTYIVPCGKVGVWISDKPAGNGDFALGPDRKWHGLGKWHVWPSREYALYFLRGLTPPVKDKLDATDEAKQEFIKWVEENTCVVPAVGWDRIFAEAVKRERAYAAPRVGDRPKRIAGDGKTRKEIGHLYAVKRDNGSIDGYVMHGVNNWHGDILASQCVYLDYGVPDFTAPRSLSRE